MNNEKLEMLKRLLEEEKRRRSIKSEIYDWSKQARKEQLLPHMQKYTEDIDITDATDKKLHDWKIWLIMAGRGFGKTRTGAESIRQLVKDGYRRICLLGHTEQDVHSVMIMGESGLLNVHPDDEKPKFIPSKNMLLWSNGAQASIFSCCAYEQLRGPQFDAAWIDELAKFPKPQEAFDQLMLALRLNTANGQEPKLIITTTPKPIPLLKELVKKANDKQPDGKNSIIITQGSTFDNKDNLSQTYLDAVQDRFGRSKFGAQELNGQIIEDTEQAFCQESMLLYKNIDFDICDQIVVAVDPAVGSTRDETGIVVCGMFKESNLNENTTQQESKHKFIVLEDASGLYTPSQWSAKAVELYHKYKADYIVAEVNQGGDMVETLLRQTDEHVSYKKVYATRGKMIRAQPVASLYERGLVYHKEYKDDNSKVRNSDDRLANNNLSNNHFHKLEEQLLTPYHSHSPDRMDALVWGLTFLMTNPKAPTKPEQKDFFMYIA